MAVTEVLGGQVVADPYRWMEGEDNHEFDAWLRAQGERTASELARVPGREALYARIRDVGLHTSRLLAPTRVGERIFYLYEPVGAQVPRLELREADGSVRVLADPAAQTKRGGHASIESYRPSSDGRLVAYNLNSGDAEVTSIHVLPTDGGAELPDVIERVWGEFPVTWLPDGSGFLYTQMAKPAPGQDPMLGMRVRLHRFERPGADDPVLLGPDVGAAFRVQPEEFPFIDVPLGSRWMIASLGGARPESRLAVAPLSALDTAAPNSIPWTTVASYDDDVERYVIHDERLYLLTHRDSPNRKIVSVPLTRPDLRAAELVVAESRDAAIENLAAGRDALYVLDQRSGRAQLRRWPWHEPITRVPLPHEGWLSALDADPRETGVLVQLVGWTQPSEVLLQRDERGRFEATGIRQVTSIDPSLTQAEEVEVDSAGGARVPLSVLHQRDLARDGSHPTILLGYGGYGISLTPAFVATLSVWYERGGVFAICHVRGGGEKGEGWHEAGVRQQKMNGITDLIACGEHLVEQGYTAPSRLAVQGRSMGGLLAGRALVERPDLFAAAHLGVGILNPLRILEAKNGRNQLAELGSPETPDGLAGLLAMDPYAHVSAGTAYPAVILTVGVNDSRVAPWMTGKMAARLQAATRSGKPVRVRVDPAGGHGVGASADQRFGETADVFSFLLAAFGDPAFVATPGSAAAAGAR